MITIRGKNVFGGIAIGKLKFYQRKEKKVEHQYADNPAAETKRFHNARKTAIKQLEKLHLKAIEDVGESNAAIFEIHQMLLEDLDYIEAIENLIQKQKTTAEFAITSTAENFAKMFASMEDAYMQGRAADVRDVSERVIDVLSGNSVMDERMEEPVIIAADDLSPSETIALDKNMILGFVTMYGSTNSHTAILARTMSIPAVIGLGEELIPEFDGKEVIVDGFTGTIYIEPSDDILAEMKKKQMEDLEQQKLLDELRGKESITSSGQKIHVCANIGNVSDVEAVLKNDADGIGLFRTEFIYLESKTYPTEEQQFEVYKQVAQDMKGKKVTIRTLDIGADKQTDYFKLPREENPAMGYRAIRISLTQPEVFKTQLRALYRASAFGQIAIMFPMIISASEVKKIREILDTVKRELDETSVKYNKDLEIGIMIETPAAVMISQELAAEVDFFSIGTNDLTQYTLAIDRQNQKLETFLDPYHPAIMRMIQITVKNAHAKGKWVGICGELGADPELTQQFIDMGIDELSVAPSMVLPLRRKVRECN